MAGGLILALAAAHGAQAPAADGGPRTIGFAERVSVAERLVRLGDLADLSPLPAALKGPAAALAVTSFRPGQSRMAFTAATLAGRLRALMPALAPWLAGGDQTIAVDLVQAAPPQAGQAASCARALKAVPAGDYPTAADFAASECGAAVKAAVRYDASVGSARAVRDVTAGEIVAAVPLWSLAAIRPGETLTLEAHAGPVIVRRNVTAVQAAKPGAPLFVKPEDGQVFAVPFPEDGQ